MTKNIFANKLLYMITIISWFYFDFFSSFNDDIKYVIMLFHFGIMFFVFPKSSKSQNNLKRLKNIIIIYIFMLVYSFFCQMINLSFNVLSLKYIFYYIFPAFISYELFTKDNKNSSFYFNFLFFAACITFLIKAKDFLNISSILSISFVNSYSPFEEIGLADIFLLLFVFFLKNNNKIFSAISAFFCFLCFKRFHLIFLVIFFIFHFFEKNKKLNFYKSKKVNKFVRAIFLVSPFIIMILYSPKMEGYFSSLLNMNFNDFVKGRYNLANYVLDAWRNNNLINTGLGTTELYLRSITNGFIGNMHNDSLRLFVETSYIGVWLMVNKHFKNTKNLPYSFMILIFIFTTMCVSHIMNSFMTWLIFYYIMFMEGEDVDCDER